MNLTAVKVETKADLNRFIKLPWSIYRGAPNWVPPLIKDMKDTLDVSSNPGMGKIDRGLFLVLLDGKPAGRIFAGIDSNLNNKKNMKLGFFSLFECIDSTEAANLLFDTAFAWFREKGVDSVIGPVSPTGTDGDEYKGLLINCFDRPPMIMNSYNPEYYVRLIEQYGFEKDYDVFAYYMDKDLIFKKDPGRAIEYAQKKYGFRVDTINLKDIEGEIKAIKHVLDLAVPDEWPDLVAPSLEEVREMAKKLLTYADPDLIVIARSEEEPIGFALALPDYNQVMIRMNGRLTPLAALKYLWYKRKINSARVFVMFVIPSFRSKGASYAIYYRVFKNGVDKGYYWGEGSTIGETNHRMRADIEGFGARHYKTYRIFKKSV